jgi:hypothetical protein
MFEIFLVSSRIVSFIVWYPKPNFWYPVDIGILQNFRPCGKDLDVFWNGPFGLKALNCTFLLSNLISSILQIWINYTVSLKVLCIENKTIFIISLHEFLCVHYTYGYSILPRTMLKLSYNMCHILAINIKISHLYCIKTFCKLET